MKAARRTTVAGAILVIALIAIAGVVFQRWPRAIPIAAADTIFVYSPHADDETYGMGQAIAEHALAGRRVIGVLMTDGDASGKIPEWIASAGEDLDGDGDIDKWDFGLARREEYRAAMGALGAETLIFLGSAGSHGAEGFRDGALDRSSKDLSDAIESIVTSVAPSSPVAHMTVAKVDQGRPLASEPREHPDHTALSDVVLQLAENRAEELYLYKVYVLYEAPWWKRWTNTIVRGSDTAIARKHEAIEAYAGIGRASTPELWEASREGDLEYLAVALPGGLAGR
jgi:LmbE family N-acetylglucosaminyl deacetylase